MNKYFSILFLILLLCSCSHKNLPINTNTSIIDKSTTVTERVVWINKIISFPIEHKQQITFTDSSHLETSIAISDAKILDNGRLFHSIYNKKNILKDSIPTIEKKIVIKNDSIITIKEIMKVEKELSLIQKIMIKLGYVGIGFLLFLGCKLWLRFK